MNGRVLKLSYSMTSTRQLFLILSGLGYEVCITFLNQTSIGRDLPPKILVNFSLGS